MALSRQYTHKHTLIHTYCTASVCSGQLGNFSTCANQTSSITVINSATVSTRMLQMQLELENDAVICEKFKAISMSPQCPTANPCWDRALIACLSVSVLSSLAATEVFEFFLHHPPNDGNCPTTVSYRPLARRPVGRLKARHFSYWACSVSHLATWHSACQFWLNLMDAPNVV